MPLLFWGVPPPAPVLHYSMSIPINFRVKPVIASRLSDWATETGASRSALVRGLLVLWSERDCPRAHLPGTVALARGETAVAVAWRPLPADAWLVESLRGHCGSTRLPLSHALSHAWAVVVSRASVESRSRYREDDPQSPVVSPDGYAPGLETPEGTLPWWPAARLAWHPSAASLPVPPYPLRRPELDAPPSPTAWPALAPRG